MLKIIENIEPWSFLLGMFAGVVIAIAALVVVMLVELNKDLSKEPNELLTLEDFH